MKADTDARLSRANPISRAAAEGPARLMGGDLLAAIITEPRETPPGPQTSPSERNPLATGRRFAGWPPPRVAAAALTCLALGGTAMAATGVWDPDIGSHAPYSPPPRISTTPVPAAITAELGVLRREPEALDRGSGVEATLSTLGNYFVQDVRPESVRYLGANERGEATIVFSAEDSVWSKVSQSHQSVEGVDGEPICIGGPSKRVDGEASAICWDLNQIISGEALSAIQESHLSYGKETLGSGWAEGLVPDGVTSVTATMADGAKRQVPVHDNYFRFEWAPSEADPTLTSILDQSQITWHDATGAVVTKRSGNEG
jgi:hypothetical protein